MVINNIMTKILIDKIPKTKKKNKERKIQLGAQIKN